MNEYVGRIGFGVRKEQTTKLRGIARVVIMLSLSFPVWAWAQAEEQGGRTSQER
jgi:hypothetical protein